VEAEERPASLKALTSRELSRHDKRYAMKKLSILTLASALFLGVASTLPADGTTTAPATAPAAAPATKAVKAHKGGKKVRKHRKVKAVVTPAAASAPADKK
jgi:hypothetical protein